MQSVANWIDPLISEENPYLEKRQHGESDKKKEEYLGELMNQEIVLIITLISYRKKIKMA